MSGYLLGNQNMHELWKPIPGFPYYEVSNLGRVRNLGGYAVNCGPNNKGSRIVRAREIKPFVVKSTGYMQVLLPDRKKHSVHRLVATLFHGLPQPGFPHHTNRVPA